MYSFIRLLIGCIFLICSYILIKRSKYSHNKTLYIVFLCLSGLLPTVLSFIPFENSFITFKSLDSAYHYVYGKSDIELVVEGDDCDFVVGSQKDKDKVTYAFMPKTADGWKASKNINAKRIIVQNYDFGFLDVYQSKGTKDYFITILNKTDKDLIISDKYNSEFEPLISGEDSLGQMYTTYYAHIPNFDSSYSLTVNGTEIVLQKP